MEASAIVVRALARRATDTAHAHAATMCVSHYRSKSRRACTTPTPTFLSHPTHIMPLSSFLFPLVPCPVVFLLLFSLPLAFYGKHDESKVVREVWEGVWAATTEGTDEAAIRTYMPVRKQTGLPPCCFALCVCRCVCVC